MSHSRQKERWMIYTLAVLLCMVLASFWLMCNIYARYSSQASGSDEARVALFGHSENIQVPKNWTNSLVPGSTNSYTLQVTNQRENNISEITQEYTIEIKTAGNLPLKYTLIDENKKEIGTFSENGQESSKIFSSDDMKFKAGEAGEHSYTIQVEWPAENNKAGLQGIPDYTMITIQTRQID